MPIEDNEEKEKKKNGWNSYAIGLYGLWLIFTYVFTYVYP